MTIDDRIRARWWWRHADLVMYLPTVVGAVVQWVVGDGALLPDGPAPGSNLFLIGLGVTAVVGTAFQLAGRWSSDEDDPQP